MKPLSLFFLLAFSGFNLIAQAPNALQHSNDEHWRLGWRVVESHIDKNYHLAASQFDSLRQINPSPDLKFLLSGLEAKVKLGQEQEVSEILHSQAPYTLNEVCLRRIMRDLPPCEDKTQEPVSNPDLQLELLTMYLNDQAARGNLMEYLFEQYELDPNTLSKNGPNIVDEHNQVRLKEIIARHGFPTRSLVGREAMIGVFAIIQHADRDTSWQAAQLEQLELAVANGDLEAQHYAYLYDRVALKRGQKQLYGTQFGKVDPVAGIVELADTEDPTNLDKRRMKMGLMPSAMYKRLLFKAF